MEVGRISCKGLSDPALRIKGDDDDDDGMECAWRGSSDRSSIPVGGGEGSRSRRHCTDSVLLALLRGRRAAASDREAIRMETFDFKNDSGATRGAGRLLESRNGGLGRRLPKDDDDGGAN